jgi:hypothetical protein
VKSETEDTTMALNTDLEELDRKFRGNKKKRKRKYKNKSKKNKKNK